MKSATRKTSVKKTTTASNKKVYSKGQARASATRDRMNSLHKRMSK